MSLLVVHVLIGCDSTSSFTGIGKGMAFKILQTKITGLQPLYDIADLVRMSSDAINDTIKFLIWLYDKTTDTNQINEICYKLFAQKILILKIYHQQKMHLTNTSGEFLLIYLEKTQCILINMPSPVGKGWKKQDRYLDPN